MTNTMTMSYKSSFFFLFILICIVIVLPDQISAQPSFPDDPDQIPIDGGLAILFAAGTGYALKKLKTKERNKITDYLNLN